ncbi:hypothetical protein ACVR1I_06070 [Streptococcus cameli]
MYPPKKSVAPLVLGILSMIFALLIPIVGLILGIIGLILSLNGNKAPQIDALGNPVAPFNYKTEIILNSLGIVIAVANMLYTYFVLLPQILG